MLGHVSVCVTALNRIQGMVAEHRNERVLKRMVYLWGVAGLTFPMMWMFVTAEQATPWGLVARQLDTKWTYYTVATAWLMVTGIKRGIQIVSDRCPHVWQLRASRVIRLDQQLGKAFTDESTHPFWVGLPGNEVGQLEVNQKWIRCQRLPSELEGLTITHFSDLHITGALAWPFFELLHDEILELDSDLIFLTGDIVDDRSKINRVTELVTDLRARYGSCFVLGNHDVRHGQDQQLRTELQRCGWGDLGGKSVEIGIHGQTVLLAGNELPWIGSAPDCNPLSADFSICASHSPDQVAWGRQQGFDLMLAGHVHGGQIRLPAVGPIICPSSQGVRYASGVFESKNTVLHVSRGVSGLQPVRWRCRPELTQMVLTSREFE